MAISLETPQLKRVAWKGQLVSAMYTICSIPKLVEQGVKVEATVSSTTPLLTGIPISLESSANIKRV